MALGAGSGGGRRALSAGYAASALLHVAFLGWLVALPPMPRAARETVAFDLVEVAPAPVPAPPPPAPDPEPIVARKAARGRRPLPPRDAPPPPAKVPEALPPPNQPPPADAPKKAPLRIGVSMSSTTSAGAIAAPTGNTLYGELPREAPGPEAAQAYRADGTAPPAEVSVLPKAIRTEIPRDEYPREAREDGVQGAVSLRLLVGVDGRVREAKVTRDPLGLGSAAANSALRHFLFEPARRGKEPVATWVTFTVRYELE